MENKKTLSMPIAIIIAGIIIAGAVYFSGKNNAPAASQTAQTPEAGRADIKISALSAAEHIVGNPSAAVVFVEYSDTECPFCKQFHVSMNRLMDTIGKEGKMAWAYRHFPLWKADNGVPALHSRAGKEAEALECAAKLGGNTKFWEYTNRLYATTPANNQLDPAKLPVLAKEVGLNEANFTSCLNGGEFAAKVETQYQEAKSAGALGTPYTVILTTKEFKPADLNKKLAELSLKYRSSPEYFTLGNDNKTIGMSGAQPFELMKELVEFLQ